MLRLDNGELKENHLEIVASTACKTPSVLPNGWIVKKVPRKYDTRMIDKVNSLLCLLILTSWSQCFQYWNSWIFTSNFQEFYFIQLQNLVDRKHDILLVTVIASYSCSHITLVSRLDKS